MLAHDLDVDDCPDSPSPPQRMSVIERARHVQGLAERRVRRARPSKPRAGTVTSLSARTLTGGDVGIGRDVRPSYVQVGAGARMHGFTTCDGRALPSIRTLDNMDTPLSRRRWRRGRGPGRRSAVGRSPLRPVRRALPPAFARARAPVRQRWRSVRSSAFLPRMSCLLSRVRFSTRRGNGFAVGGGSGDEAALLEVCGFSLGRASGFFGTRGPVLNGGSTRTAASILWFSFSSRS